MVLPGHLAGGYLAAQGVLALAPALAGGLGGAEITALIVLGTLMGDGPDIDLAIYHYNQRSARPSHDDNGHRQYPTHTPIFWFVIAAVVAGIGALSGSAFVILAGAVILAGSWSHLLFDSIEFGIRWVWPLSTRRFRLLDTPEPAIDAPSGSLAYYIEVVRKTAFRSATFYAEIAITAIAIWHALRVSDNLL